MGTTFVGINNRGFWINDGILELWLRFLALHIEDPDESGTQAAVIRDQWLLASRGYFVGCVPDELQAVVSERGGEALVRKAICSFMSALQAGPPRLDMDVLNLMGIKDSRFLADVETWRLLEIGDAFLELLDGKITTDATDSSFMPGSRERPHAR